MKDLCHKQLFQLARGLTNPEQKDGYYFTCTWNENETEIYPVWEEHLLPEPELTDGEYLLEKLGL